MGEYDDIMRRQYEAGLLGLPRRDATPAPDFGRFIRESMTPQQGMLQAEPYNRQMLPEASPYLPFDRSLEDRHFVPGMPMGAGQPSAESLEATSMPGHQHPQAEVGGGMQAPQTWGQQFAARVLGPQGTQLSDAYQRDALVTGLLQGASALGQRGGAKANWGNALLQGFAGVRAGVQGGQQRMREDAYRASLERAIADTQDPLEKIRLQYMLQNTERYAQPETPAAPRRPETKWLPDPNDPTGQRVALHQVFEDGTTRQITQWAMRPQSPRSRQGMDPLRKQMLHDKIMAAREEVAALDAFEREGLSFSNPSLYKLARDRSPLEESEGYDEYMAQWRRKPTGAEANAADLMDFYRRLTQGGAAVPELDELDETAPGLDPEEQDDPYEDLKQDYLDR